MSYRNQWRRRVRRHVNDTRNLVQDPSTMSNYTNQQDSLSWCIAHALPRTKLKFWLKKNVKFWWNFTDWPNRGRWIQIFRYRDKIREEYSKQIFEFRNWNFQILNTKSKFRLGHAWSRAQKSHLLDFQKTWPSIFRRRENCHAPKSSPIHQFPTKIALAGL